MLDALFSARGRMRRRDWWLWSIAVVIVYFLSEVVMHGFFGVTSFKDDVTFKGLPSNIFQYWVLGAGLASGWPRVCLLAKRWHDRGRSGWLAAISIILTEMQVVMQHFGGLVDGFAPQFIVGAVQAGLGLVSFAFWLWVLIDCGILDGTQGQNRYGPSPKGVGAQPEDIF